MAREETEYVIKLRDEQSSGRDGVVYSGFEGSNADIQGQSRSVRDWSSTLRYQAASAAGNLLNPFQSTSQLGREAAETGAAFGGAKLGAAFNMEEFGEALGRSIAKAVMAVPEYIESKARGEVGGIGTQLARAGVDRETIKELMRELLPVSAAAAQREADTLGDLNTLDDARFVTPQTNIGDKLAEKVNQLRQSQMGAGTAQRVSGQILGNEG